MNTKKGNAGKPVAAQVKAVKATAKKMVARKSVVKNASAAKKTSKKTPDLTEVVFIIDRRGSTACMAR